jgi:hypothetical protein
VFKRRQAILSVALVITSATATAWQTLTDNMDISCSQTTRLQLHCDYRLLIPEPPLSIEAKYNNKALPLTNKDMYPWPGAVTAVLLLVDTSDPAREEVIRRNQDQINAIVNHAKPYDRIGLASFDKDLKIEAPVGSDKDRILKAAAGLRATGMTTELYRNTIQAIDVLAGIKADRKVIFLLSDGQAEDKAYFHQDVIRAARKHDVIINSLGYPRSVALSVALQTLRRLSDESGGAYVEADNNYHLPDNFLRMPFDNVDRGGRFRISLASLTAPASAKPAVHLIFGTDVGDIQVNVPVNLPAPAPAASGQAPASPAAATPGGEEDVLDAWLWYGVPAALLLLIVLAAVSLILLTRRQTPVKSTGTTSPAEFKPYAYLIAQDEKATRYPITRTTWRIGRSRDNEMTLDDNSISRRHAEIQRLANGRFMLSDRDSLNGVFVNDHKVNRHILSEGDIIEIGDFFLRFTQNPLDYQLAEDTVMMKTKTPIH